MQNFSPHNKSFKTLYILNAIRLVCVVMVGVSYGMRGLEYMRFSIICFAVSQFILSVYELRSEISLGRGGVIHGKVAQAFAIINPIFFGVIGYLIWDTKF